MKSILSKKAAMELSIGTIVIIVLAMSMLIFGIILVRKIMCTGLIMTDDIGEGIKTEIRSLFGQQDYGVKCMGEGGQEIKIADGGRRNIVCIIKTDEDQEYTLKTNVKSLDEDVVSTTEVQNWIIDKDWSGKVKPGDTEATILVLDIPKKVSTITLKITIDANGETHVAYIDVVHAGALSSAIC